MVLLIQAKRLFFVQIWSRWLHRLSRTQQELISPYRLRIYTAVVAIEVRVSSSVHGRLSDQLLVSTRIGFVLVQQFLLRYLQPTLGECSLLLEYCMMRALTTNTCLCSCERISATWNSLFASSDSLVVDLRSRIGIGYNTIEFDTVLTARQRTDGQGYQR